MFLEKPCFVPSNCRCTNKCITFALNKILISLYYVFTDGDRVSPEVGEASSFVEGLGPGQSVGRQALASPSLGEVQLSICKKEWSGS
ncbi:hypothetical protein CEXT_9821 [Caerostris extrusa]|uniref:Uncharacterized protein n=1 Tax=Caerostris extrusa TaxID=172846 RepID=A0AAV4YBQ4_CAEEX|nr:hypothetical protein CEXT_9821 [Caerostris extrusa]